MLSVTHVIGTVMYSTDAEAAPGFEGANWGPCAQHREGAIGRAPSARGSRRRIKGVGSRQPTRGSGIASFAPPAGSGGDLGRQRFLVHFWPKERRW